MSQGQSIITEEKQRGFGSFFTANLQAFSGINGRLGNKYRYWHFDLHSGKGFNDDVGVIGSPVLFAQLADKIGVPYLMCAIDKCEHAIRTLADAMADNPNCFPICGDNRELIHMIPNIIERHGENPSFANGSILLDPNNARSEGLPWVELSRLAVECPRLDIAINFPARCVKRSKGVRKRFGSVRDDLVEIDDLPSLLNKQHWQIRYPLGVWDFTLSVGRNMRFRPHAKIDLYDWNSHEGRDARRKAGMTEQERAEFAQRGQQLLWQDM